MSAQLTVISSARPKVLTKRVELDAGGRLQRKTAAQMTEGTAITVTIDAPAVLGELLQSLGKNNALCFGVTGLPSVRVLSRKRYDELGQPVDAITRTKDRFSWPRMGGVLMLDYDPPAGQTPLTRQQLHDAIGAVSPDLQSCGAVWWCSSSSLIYHDGQQLTGIAGQRVYILVEEASDIERAGKVLFDRLCLAGHGYYAVSRAGRALERSLIDSSVWQTNRLDFAAGADCVAPLEQRRGEPVIREGHPLDTLKALPDLTDDEQVQLREIRKVLRDEVETEVQIARDAYLDEEAAKILTQCGKPLTDENIDHARATIKRALEQKMLMGDFVVHLADGQTVTVGEILDDPGKYHGKLTLDPLEPEYGNRRVCGKLYLMGGGRPCLHSQAHGGQTFRLLRQPRKIEHVAGRSSDTTHSTLELLGQLPDVFDYGDDIALVADGKAHIMELATLQNLLGTECQFWKWQQTKNGAMYEANIDPPNNVLQQVLALRERRNLKRLEAVITAPVITLDNRVIDRPGYDERTRLFLHADTVQNVPHHVTPAMAQAAAERLMQPFEGFDYAGDLDRAVVLSAALTAIQRAILPTSPAIGLDAPAQGTGKTYLAQCLGFLCNGDMPAIHPHTAGHRGDDEETRKRLLTILRTGDASFIWDNVLGLFDSAALAAFLTSPSYTDRVLGKSESATYPNRVMVLVTGNNLTPAGDLPRRILKCRLDAGCANPALRKFSRNPLQEIIDTRQELVTAGLTLIRGYLQSQQHAAGGAVSGSTASFETWDTLCRQPVAWLPGWADPGEALRDAVANDPELMQLGEILSSIDTVMGGGWFEVADLVRRIENGASMCDPDLIELRDNLIDMGGMSRFTSKGVGRVLSYRVGRIADRRRLDRTTTAHRTRYRVKNHESAV